MRLSRDEEVFLRHWMHDEVHYGEGTGPAKRLQLRHRAVPADLAVLIAAAIPDPSDQESAGLVLQLRFRSCYPAAPFKEVQDGQRGRGRRLGGAVR